MSANVEGLIELYAGWLKRGSTEEELEGGWKALTLPFLDRHNDHLRVFVRKGNDELRITDDGQTIRDLKQTGCDLKTSPRRRMVAERILRSQGLSPELLDSGELSTTAVNGDFPSKLHQVLLSMLAIEGLANTSSPNVLALFKEDVAGWLSKHEVTFVSGVDLPGSSGTKHQFDFQIPPTTYTPARVLHSLPTPDRMHVQSFAYEVLDTRKSMNGDSPEFFAFLNDANGRNKKSYLTLLAQEIRPLWWSDREKHLHDFMRNH